MTKLEVGYLVWGVFALCRDQVPCVLRQELHPFPGAA
jgi:hypothetical protein